MGDKLIVTFNAGSSSLKIGVFSASGGHVEARMRGLVDFRAKPLSLSLKEGGRNGRVALQTQSHADMASLVDEVLDVIAARKPDAAIIGVGHRVVHGGDVFAGPVLLDDEAIESLDALCELAPLHQPQNLSVVRALKERRPDLPQTASFDTAFHATNSDLVRRFAIARELHDKGIKRYGFHGLSYKHIAAELARIAPDVAGGRVVVAHLGSGVSLCAMSEGQSRDTSMGFSTLDGAPMATRCGALDPGVILHLAGPMGWPLSDVHELLYKKSGLLGVSGESADMRVLLESDAPAAKQAIELFCLRVAGEAARLVATLGGLDAFVFTAGVGEHQPQVREQIAARLAWLGLTLDPEANAGDATRISAPYSRVAVFDIPTDEEQTIAEEALSVLPG